MIVQEPTNSPINRGADASVGGWNMKMKSISLWLNDPSFINAVWREKLYAYVQVRMEGVRKYQVSMKLKGEIGSWFIRDFRKIAKSSC